MCFNKPAYLSWMLVVQTVAMLLQLGRPEPTGGSANAFLALELILLVEAFPPGRGQTSGNYGSLEGSRNSFKVLLQGYVNRRRRPSSVEPPAGWAGRGAAFLSSHARWAFNSLHLLNSVIHQTRLGCNVSFRCLWMLWMLEMVRCTSRVKEMLRGTERHEILLENKNTNCLILATEKNSVINIFWITFKNKS